MTFLTSEKRAKAVYVPYSSNPEFFEKLYAKTKDDNLLGVVFGTEINRKAFINLMTDARPYVLSFDGCLAGYAWLRDFSGRSVTIHFCLFDWTHGEHTEAIGRKFLRTVFEDGALDSLYGAIAASNRLAIRYARRLGFKVLGSVPSAAMYRNKVDDMTIVTITHKEVK